MATQNRLPTGDSATYDQWTALGAGYKYAEVADPIGSPDDDTSYISSAVYGDVQAFTFASFNISASAIEKLSITVRMKRQTGEYPNTNVDLKVGGTWYLGTPYQPEPANTWDTHTYEFTTNPRTTTSWTQDDINGVGDNGLQEFGVVVVFSYLMKVTQVYATVTYTEAGGPQYGRAIADVAAGSWTASSGSDLYACIDESTADDADYISSAAVPSSDTAILTLTDLDTPSTGTVTLRIRGKWGS